MSTVSFSMRIDDSTMAELEREASLESRSVSWVAQRAIEAYLGAKKAKRSAVREAVADANEGVFVSGEAVDRWVESWGGGGELARPGPDIRPANG